MEKNKGRARYTPRPHCSAYLKTLWTAPTIPLPLISSSHCLPANPPTEHRVGIGRLRYRSHITARFTSSSFPHCLILYFPPVNNYLENSNSLVTRFSSRSQVVKLSQ